MSEQVKLAERRPATARWSRTTVVFAVAIAALIVLALASAAIGQVPTSIAEVTGSVLHRIGLDWGRCPRIPQAR